MIKGAIIGFLIWCIPSAYAAFSPGLRIDSGKAVWGLIVLAGIGAAVGYLI